MMFTKYKAVIYDWDGCLLSSLPAWVEAYKRTLKTVGIEATPAALTRVIGNWQAFHLLGHPDPEQANKEFLGYLHEHVQDSVLFPNVIDSLTAMKKKGLKVYLVTAGKKEILRASKEFEKVEKFFDHAIFADDVKHVKPNPEAVNLILKKFGHKPEETIMIGDSDNDILVARNAKIDCLWFAPPENASLHDYDYLAALNPTRRFSDHKELLSMFNYMQTLPDRQD